MAAHDVLTDPTRSAAAASSKGVFWMFVPVGLLVVSSAGWLSMVSVAVHDPGFSVERDYYKKASNYDQELDQRAHNAALGWRVRLVGARRSADGTAQWTIQVVDARGNPLDQLAITAEAFAVARGGDLRISTLSQLGEGRYQLNVARARLGLWEVRIRADQGNSTFTDVLRVDLALGEEPPS